MTESASSAAAKSAGDPQPVAAIDIGTSSIRMAIAEIIDGDTVRTLETLSQGVRLGEDTFTQGSIAKSTIEDCVRVLSDYRRKLDEYQIARPEQMRVVATSAVREAANQLAFVDRIYIATGLEVEVLDEAEVHRITYRGVRKSLQASPDLFGAQTLIAEVGGGSTELLLVQHGDVAFAHSYRLGSLRLREMLEAYDAPATKRVDIMRAQISRTLDQLPQHVPISGPAELVALGGDVRFAARELLPDWNWDSLATLSVKDLKTFATRLLALTEEQLVQRFHMTFPEAETVGPALLVYLRLAEILERDRIYISNVNLRDGLLQEMVEAGIWTDDFRKQIVRSALELGRKFEFDEDHAVHVAELTGVLFDALRDEHQLDERYRLLLYTAALLHEIGGFISTSSLHKHSMYLIMNSELFGLTRSDVLLVALIARYHRRSSPKPTHTYYSNLNRDERVAVSKLAALLRIADALEGSRSQRVRDIRCRKEPGRLVIEVPHINDLSIEQLAMKLGRTLFDEVYGRRVLLRAVED